MSVVLRKYAPMALLGFLGFLMVASYFSTIEILGYFSRELQNWSSIISAIALGFAAFILLRQHVPRSLKGNIYSIALVGSMGLLPILYLITGSTVSFQYNWVYQTWVGRLDPSMYSLVAFSIISGLYRAFRVRNIDSLLLLVTAIILLIGQVPVGGVLKPVVNWFLDVLNTGGYRGVQLGIGIGLFAYALRLLIGIERTWLSELKGE